MNKRAYVIRATVLLLVFLSATRAQQVSKPSKSDERIVTATNLVTVNVTVTDRDGRYVKGLGRDQFAVYDEKVKQQIVHFTAAAAPVSIGIVCEIHNARPERARAMLIALKQFTRSLRNDDDFFFVAFGPQGSLTTEFIPTADQVLDHLMAVRPGGPSSLYDAVYGAADRLRTGRNLKKALLIVSDGEDDNSHRSYNELRNRLKDFDVQVYCIGIANPSMGQLASHGRWVVEDITRQTGRRPFLLNAEASTGRAVLAEMSRVSGGTTYFPESENEPELLAICAQIALELHEQYTIGFYPAEQPANKDWHRIRVKLNTGQNSRGPVLSYRQGYRRSKPS